VGLRAESVLVVVAVVSATSAVQAETAASEGVVLRGGGRVEGRVAKFREGEYVVVVTPDDDVVMIPWAEVEKVDRKAGVPNSDPGRVDGDVASAKKPASPGRLHVGHTTPLEASLRTGISKSLGSVSGAAGSSMSDYFPTAFPVIVGVGVRPLDPLYVGVFGRYAFGSVGDAYAARCDAAAADCSAHGIAFGVEAAYRFAPDSKLDPWAGYGFGYSLDELKATSKLSSDYAVRNGLQEVEVRSAVRGFDFARLSGGLDVHLTPLIAVGGFLELTLSRYDSQISEASAGTPSNWGGTFGSKSLHSWVTLGPRLVVTP
jgi:hypothetical protein